MSRAVRLSAASLLPVLLLAPSSVQASAQFTYVQQLGLAKRLFVISSLGGTEYDASFVLVVENLG